MSIMHGAQCPVYIRHLLLLPRMPSKMATTGRASGTALWPAGLLYFMVISIRLQQPTVAPGVVPRDMALQPLSILCCAYAPYFSILERNHLTEMMRHWMSYSGLVMWQDPALQHHHQTCAQGRANAGCTPELVHLQTSSQLHTEPSLLTVPWSLPSWPPEQPAS